MRPLIATHVTPLLALASLRLDVRQIQKNQDLTQRRKGAKNEKKSDSSGRTIRPGSRRAARLRSLCFLLSFWLIFTQNQASAQRPPALLSAEIDATSPPVRAGAPATILWKLRSQSSALLKGMLEVSVYDGTELIVRLVTDEQAVGTGDSHHRTVLPPLSISNTGYGALEVDLRLLTDRKPIDLGRHSLRVPNLWQRTLVIGVADARQAAGASALDTLLDSLRFENYSPLEQDRTLTTSVFRVGPDDLLADPLTWCGYDVAVLCEEGFAELRDNQLQAVLRWVDAGGSLCVAPARATLKEQHVRFLHELCASGPDGGLFSLDARGQLLDPENDASAGDALLLKRFGLGRVALIRGELERLIQNSTDVRRMAAHLWKLRRDQAKLFVAVGQWDAYRLFDTTAAKDPLLKQYLERSLGQYKKMQSERAQRGEPVDPEIEAIIEQRARQLSDLAAKQNASGAQDPQLVQQQQQQQAVIAQQMASLRPHDMQLASMPIQTGDQLLEQLMPRDLKIVPLKLIGLILVLYVVAIGPGDYFFLGILKKRKWTWLLFPATTVAVAAGTIVLSHWYMRVSAIPRRVTVLDIGAGNRVARTSAFETLFRGTPGEAVTDVTRKMLCPMSLQRFSQGSWFNYQQAQAGGTAQQYRLAGTSRFTGRVPTQYAVQQYLPQWTPQLNRMFGMSSPEDAVEFDWQSLAGQQFGSVSDAEIVSAAKETAEKLIAALGAPSAVFIATADRLRLVSGETDALQSAAVVSAYQWQSQEGRTFLHDICLYPHGGFFNVVSQISPKGGDDFEDLALLDPSDPNQWLLIVVAPRGDDLIVYRKLYTGE